TGKYLYVANSDSDDVSQLTVGAGGGLVPMATPTIGGANGAEGIALDPTGHYAYVTSYGARAVAQYIVGPDGSLTPHAPAIVAAQLGPYGIAVSPLSTKAVPVARHAYVSSFDSGTVSLFDVTAGGALAAVQSTPTDAPNARAIGLDPTGRFAWVTNFLG